MQIGDRVELIEDADYSPYTIVRAGERGAIEYINKQTGEVDIVLDAPHPGLDGNCIWIIPSRAVGPRFRVMRRYSAPTYLKVAAAVVVGVTAAAVQPEVARAVRGPAAEFKSFELVNDHIHAGDPLIMRNTARRYRVCFWVWENSWTNADGDVVSRTKVPGAGQAVTPDFRTYNVFIKTPPNLPPGEYQVSSVGRADCDHGDRFTEMQPALKFTVEK